MNRRKEGNGWEVGGGLDLDLYANGSLRRVFWNACCLHLRYLPSTTTTDYHTALQFTKHNTRVSEGFTKANADPVSLFLVA